MINKQRVILGVIALLVGLIHILPHLIAFKTTPADRVYYPISFSELVYGSKVKETLEGRLLAGDAQLFEHKDQFSKAEPFVPTLLLSVLSLASRSIPNAFFVSDFIFPALLFLLLFGFTYEIRKNFELAIFASLATIIIYPVTTKIPPISLNLLEKLINKVLIIDVSSALPFARTPNPQISYPLFVLALWSLYLVHTRYKLKYLLACSFFGVILFATYFYPASYFLFIVLTLTALSRVSKDLKSFKHLGPLLIVLLICVFLYKTIADTQPFGVSKEIAGQFYARYFDWVFALRYASVFLLVLIIFKRLNRKLSNFLSALIIAAIGIMNIQIITGWTIQPGHWPQTVIEPTMVIVAIVLASQYFKKRNLSKVLAFLSITILVYGFLYQAKFAVTYKNGATITREAQSLLTWLNNNTTEKNVVASFDVNTLVYVPVFTNANIFTPILFHNYSTLDESWQRLIYNYKIYNISNFDSLETLTGQFAFDQAYNVNKYKHYSWNEYDPNLHERAKNCLPSTCSGIYIMPKSTKQFQKSVFEKAKIENNPYKLDYVIYSNNEKQLGGQPPNGEKVYSSQNYSVYTRSQNTVDY